MSRAQVSIVKSKSSPNTTEIDEAEIAKLVSDGGLKPETLARRKRVRAAFQAFTIEHYEKDVTALINGLKEDLSKAVCAFLSTLCVNKRQSDLKMAWILPHLYFMEISKHKQNPLGLWDQVHANIPGRRYS